MLRRIPKLDCQTCSAYRPQRIGPREVWTDEEREHFLKPSGAREMNDDEIENEIIEKGLTAPRVTLADIEAAIASEHCFTAQHGIEGALDKLELFQRYAETDTLAQQAPEPSYGSLSRLTFCVLVLRSGYTVVGQSACVSPENFDAELGRKIARANAIDQCWPLFGFELASRIAAQ